MDLPLKSSSSILENPAGGTRSDPFMNTWVGIPGEKKKII